MQGRALGVSGALIPPISKHLGTDSFCQVGHEIEVNNCPKMTVIIHLSVSTFVIKEMDEGNASWPLSQQVLLSELAGLPHLQHEETGLGDPKVPSAQWASCSLGTKPARG